MSRDVNASTFRYSLTGYARSLVARKRGTRDVSGQRTQAASALPVIRRFLRIGLYGYPTEAAPIDNGFSLTRRVVNLLDVALNGALGAAPDSDTRDALDVASIVCGELSSGSDITDACAAAIVSPARYLAWVHDRADVRELHERALAIRARLLADVPLALARALSERRQGRGPSLGVTLGELAKAVATEATLTERATSGRLEDKASAPTIVVRFDTLPAYAAPLPAPAAASGWLGDMQAVALSDGGAPGGRELSDDIAYTYDDDGDALDDA